ncbi:MAG TPA: HAD family hydrolase [Dehalococcoidia bacterium]|nr:HAD family hydrolase [Dehalococcoidia bacterium]
MSPRITAVLFDLGDTLWHFPSMPPVDVIRAETVGRISRLLEAWGFGVRDERRFLGRDIRLAVEEETGRAFHGDCIDPGYPELCRRVAAGHGLELRSEQGEELWEAWNLGGPFLGRTLFPDALDTLRWLRGRGYRLGAVTNRGYAGPRFQQELRDVGLAELFEVMAVSCEVGYMKPHPRIFQYALDHMGLEAEETAMVGDSLRADVEGAKTMGMVAVWRRPPAGEPVEDTADPPELEGPVRPHYTVDALAELRDLPLFRDRGTAK